MVRVSSKARLKAGVAGKVVLTVLIGIIAVVALVLASYKPVYSVLINGEFKGYVSSKDNLQSQIETYLREGEGDNVGYILLNTRPEYEFSLIKKDIVTKDEEILQLVKNECDIYYRVYAINVNDEEKAIVDSLDAAQQIVDKVNSATKNYTKKASVVVSEKYQNVLDISDDIQLVANDIINPLKAENEELVKKYQSYTVQKTVPQAVLDSLREMETDLHFGLPLSSYVVTSRFGWRRMGYHTGVDFAAPIGTPILALEDGVVTCAEWKGNYGYLVRIQHTGGFETYYAHCSRFACDVGDQVHKGDIIAYVGSTGNSTGPHVHTEIRYDGSYFDPATMLGEF